jgi:hypothetical protein
MLLLSRHFYHKNTAYFPSTSQNSPQNYEHRKNKKQLGESRKRKTIVRDDGMKKRITNVYSKEI